MQRGIVGRSVARTIVRSHPSSLFRSVMRYFAIITPCNTKFVLGLKLLFSNLLWHKKVQMSILGVQTSVLRSGDQFFVLASFQVIALYTCYITKA